MDGNEILAKLHNRFPSLPQNALLTIYKVWSERMRLLMKNNIPADIRWLIEAKVRLASELPPKFIAYIPGCVYKKTGWEAYPRPIDGVQAVSGRKTRGRCEPHYGKHKEFVEAAIYLGRSIAERKLHLVYGGGDLATLKALITLASWAHLHIHQKSIGLLNVNNFYDGFIAFLNHAIKNYFSPSTTKKLFICAHTANDLLDLLQAYKPEPDPWTFVLEHPNNDCNSSRSKKYKLDLTLRL
ncbi:hypothetical protein WN944_023266 [Citrus x changshan-huyou]|uniref:cytokinin riboside 5'-monophosphate phosphoribohydrolase n=1 Tax=Citrus x changshan-huyou TaxID=2935761 RepID=A0AAP0N5K7_9ROSI